MSWLLERADFCSALIVRRLVALGSYSTRFPVGSARKVAHLDHHRAMDGRDHICTYFRALPLRVGGCGRFLGDRTEGFSYVQS